MKPAVYISDSLQEGGQARVAEVGCLVCPYSRIRQDSDKRFHALHYRGLLVEITHSPVDV